VASIDGVRDKRFHYGKKKINYRLRQMDEETQLKTKKCRMVVDDWGKIQILWGSRFKGRDWITFALSTDTYYLTHGAGRPEDRNFIFLKKIRAGNKST
jgi:hypothetical protein